MKWLKRLLWLSAGVALAGFSALLLIDNATPVRLRLLAWETPAAPVFVWLLAAFGAGALVSFCLGAVSRLRGSAARRRLRRTLDASQRAAAEPAAAQRHSTPAPLAAPRAP